jgi:glutathione synthase
MPIKLAVVMDPIDKINVQKDTTLALLMEAHARHWSLFYLEQKDLFVQEGVALGMASSLKKNPYANRFTLGDRKTQQLDYFDIILMRKDPPFDMEYIYTTYILEFAKLKGVRVINDPQSLRDANEKLFAQWFPQCMPATLVSRDPALFREFINVQRDVVLKPLHAMGGGSVFRLKVGDNNINVVIEVLTDNGLRHIMAQKFIPEIAEGDKRIFILDGKPIPYALARLPAAGEIRGNLAAGGHGRGVELSERDFWIAEQVGPTLKEKGLLFVGLDVIGDYLTEINVTSPTCVRELQAFFDINISKEFFDILEKTFEV